jgi:nucleotide-binding universal stress UspA family protein
MPKLLLAVDGSEGSGRAADFLLKQLNWYREPVEVHVLNVQSALPQAVTMFVAGFNVREYHQNEGRKMLAPVLDKLDSAKVHYIFHVSVGDPAYMITQYAKEQSCDQIIMGTRGLSRTPGILLGSIATKVVHLANVPVLLVR